MNRLSFLFPFLRTTVSFVRTDPWRFSGDSGNGFASREPGPNPFVSSTGERLLDLALAVIVIGVPSAYFGGLIEVLPLLGR